MKWCTCIVPLYNEQERVISVLNILRSITLIDHIIVVNDWSTDHSQQTVQAYCAKHKHITLITYPQNTGKSHAVSIWLKHVTTPYVMTFDSDLTHINPTEIINMIESMYAHPSIDMGILRRISSNWYIKLLYRELILSGQRMLRTEDLRNIFLQRPINKYQLEVAINMYMTQHYKLTLRYPFSAENMFKYQKRWFRYGIKKDISMFKDIFIYLWLLGCCRHIISFRPQCATQYKS